MSGYGCLDAHSIETCVPSENFSHRVSDHNCPYAHRRHAHQQVDDVLFVVGKAIGVELVPYGQVFGFLFFVLVENPFQRGAVAKPIIPCFGRNAGKSRFAIDDDPAGLFVSFQYALGREPAPQPVMLAAR